MKLRTRLTFAFTALCLCTSWIVGSTVADMPTAPPQGEAVPGPKVEIVDGKKVIVQPSQEQSTSPKEEEAKKPLSEARLEYLQKYQDSLGSEIDESGAPRGGVLGACCDPFSGTCTLRDETACAGVGGTFQGDNTTCSPNNPCPQPIDCDTGVPFPHVSQLPPDPAADPFATFISDVDANQLAMEGFITAGGEITRIRWWGVELNGATNCNRTNNNFNITFFADAGLLGGGPTNPTPEIVAQFNNIAATRLKAESYALDGTQISYNGQLLWEYTVVLPQRVALMNGWLAIQAAADGGPCNFRWMSNPFGPGNLVHNGQQVDDPNGEIQDVAVCISGNSAPVNGACCDDSIQGGSCTNNTPSNQCTDFAGGDHRFRVDQTCAQLNPACGSITGSCCVGATCSIVTGPECAALAGSFIAFEDCTPNVCVGACCLGTGECQELTETDCLGQGGQFFGNGSLCVDTACPGTGRCCFDSGTQCEIRTEAACAAIAGSRWDEGITCATPCPIPPTNDLCSAAIPIECGQTITVDNTVATTDASDPLFPCRVGGPTQGVNSIWFTFVPTTSSATIKTCNSLAPADDSIIQVFDGTAGSCGAFATPIGCADDSCGLLSNVCVTNLIVGNTYYIEVAGWDVDEIGPYAVEVVCPGETCASTGACCLTSGGCAVLSEPACVGQGGTYNGDATVCGTLGACCTGPNECVLSNQFCCTESGGAYLGDGTDCGAAAGTPTTYTDSPAIPIPDDPIVNDDMTVPDNFTIGDLNLAINASHTFVGDLFITLSHDGTSVVVWDNLCGGNNDLNVTFDDGAPAVVCGQPTAGTFSPSNPLAPFNGQNSGGTWTLTIDDQAGLDTGFLNSWSLIIDGVGASPCDPDPGACCFSEGTGDCQLLNAINCALAGGRYIGGGTACAGDICVPRGACCDTVTGGCQQLTQEACQALPTGNFLGDFTSCGNCPIVLGSCCNADGSCTEGTQFNPCTTAGGSFTPNGTCDNTGACCFEDLSCILTTQTCCNFGGGAYLGDGTNCGEAAGNPTDYTDSPGVPIGAAVANASINVPDSFTVGDVNVGLNITHTWVGDMQIDIEHNGTTVRIIDGPGVEVDPPFGCDLENYNNIVIDDQGDGGAIEDQCVVNLTSPPNYTPNNPLSAFNGTDSAGAWNITIFDTFADADDGTLVSWTLSIDGVGINPCDTEPGACCFSEGIGDCQLLDAIQCAQAGGRFQGGGTACAGDICIPRGACCNTFDGSCERLTEEQCLALPNRDFLGDFTSCGSCPIILGACCVSATECTPNVRVTQCDQLGGAFLPNTGCGEGAGNPTPYSATPALAIPDAVATGVTTIINVADSFILGDVDVQLNVTHTWVGDTCFSLEHLGTSVILLERMGAGACSPAGAPFGCAEDNMNIILDDEGTGGAIETQCVANLTSPPNFTPNNPLSAFNGLNSAGDWTLTAIDNAGGDTGTLNSWAVILDAVGINPCDTEPGACCIGPTLAGCTVVDAIACSTVGGRFQGGGTTCTGDICEIRGACCNTFDGSCQQLTEAECTASPTGNYLGDFTNCGACPVITGVCCVGTECTGNTQFSQCQQQGGSFIPSVTCGDLYTATVGQAIPDNTLTGVVSTINVPETFIVGDVNVSLNITHTWVGDMCISLEHGGTTVELIQRMGADTGVPCHNGTPFGCASDNLVNTVLDDEGAAPIETSCPAGGAFTSPPNFIPNNPLSAFDGAGASGDWTLTVVDNAAGDLGTVNSWGLIFDPPAANPCDTSPGACCQSETLADCIIVNAVQCAQAGGRFQGGGSTCTGNICEIRGACCIPVTGACSQLTQAECQSAGGNFLGGFTSCGQCPVILGACCLPGDVCQANSQFNPCTAQGGAFVPGESCGEAAGDPDSYSQSPNLPITDNLTTTDTINVPDSFTIGDLNLQLVITHTFIGDLDIDLNHNGTSVFVFQDQCGSSDNMNVTLDDEAATAVVCAAAGLPTNGTFRPFAPLTPFDGQNASGAWTLDVFDDAGADVGTLVSWTLIIDGVGVNPCNTTPGACCVGEDDADCSLQTIVDCSTAGGRYQGPGSTCTPGICIIRGACCNSVLGTCAEVTPAECVGANQVYQGNFTDCDTANCVQATGACCTTSGLCQNGQTFNQCTTAGGDWSGANTTCETVTGACCLGGDDCLIVTPACCQSLEGSYAGVGTNCGVASGNPTTFTQNSNVQIPNNIPAGVTRTINVPNSFLVADVDVSVNITMQGVGQITVRITHNGVTRDIIQRIGSPAISAFGCLQNNLNVRLDDEGTAGPIENGCSGGFGTPFPTSPPNFTPNQSLSSFDNMDAAGDWTIQVIDADPSPPGTLVSWSLHIDSFSGGACSSTGQCATCEGDTNGDNSLNGSDVDSFGDCVLGQGGSFCACGDMNNDTNVNMADVAGFVQTLLLGTGPCGSVPVCSTCDGDSNGDDSIDGRDCSAFVNCLLSTPNGCPCSDIDNNNVVNMADVSLFVTALLNNTGSCP